MSAIMLLDLCTHYCFSSGIRYLTVLLTFIHQFCDRALQTLNHMHTDSNVCHLDITPGNIMPQSAPANPWDSVRLIDFGFATKFNPGDALDRKPDGASLLA